MPNTTIASTLTQAQRDRVIEKCGADDPEYVDFVIELAEETARGVAERDEARRALEDRAIVCRYLAKLLSSGALRQKATFEKRLGISELVKALAGTVDEATKTAMLRDLGEVPGYDLPHVAIAGRPVPAALRPDVPDRFSDAPPASEMGGPDDPAFGPW